MSEHIALLLTFARRGEDGEIERARDHLRQQLPDAQLVALGTPVSEPVLRRLGLEHIILYGGEQGARRAVREARARPPAAAAIVYCEPGFEAHLKLEAFALLSDARRLYLFSPGRPVKTIGRLRLACSVSGKALAAGGRLLAGMFIGGIACEYLRLAQLVAGGSRVSRA